ncbi:ribokinase [Hymenobacter arizonensis]|uniref:Ribokinase n=1 Tax=Hymenobacter arizonensis TaxID=1227077 RepID=A0A1I6BJN2_HYMAR|nr:ribokinase [Hymenobacter arizonensis]SFQ81007.1 ribokinase [Hymenobacter arizonensis]
MNRNILVIGSANTDMVITTKYFPRPGETVMGEQFLINPGGKGANQAVGAARLGGQVTFITKFGTDLFGEQGRAQLLREGIATDYVLSDPDQPSGVALITVDEHGENSIVVAPGANGTLSAADVTGADQPFAECELVLMQLEIPLPTVVAAALLATKLGKRIILNPAPAQALPDELLRALFLITPNESEAEILTGIAIIDADSLEAAAQALLAKGVKNVVITLGAEGAYLRTPAGAQHLPAVRTQPVDTTAAGDVFNGALAVALAEGQELLAAVAFANQAAAISVTRLGAQASAPYRHELRQPVTC